MTFLLTCLSFLSRFHFILLCICLNRYHTLIAAIFVLFVLNRLNTSSFRPAEVVESETEHSEEDVTDEVKRGSFSLESPTIVPFPFPGLQSDIEALERGFFGGLSNFLEEAERMTSEFFKSFGVPSSGERETSPFGQRRQLEKENPTNPTEPESSPYSEFASKVREV